MLKVTIADTIHAIERGLMFVDDLPSDEGMLFVFSHPRKLNFWGRNTFIPLDIAFINEGMQIVKIGKIHVMDLSGVDSGVACKYAIEANENYFIKAKVSVGHKVEIIDGDTPDEAYVKFTVSHNNKGAVSDPKKDNESIKQGQLAPVNDPLVPPKVDKPGTETVGDPIGTQPQMSKLPVLTKGDIGKILEDSFDEETPTEVSQPGEEPENVQPGEEDGQEAPPPPQDFPTFQTAFQAVQWAQDNNEVVHISYTTKKGRQLERDVEPHGQFHSDSTSRQILVTFDESVGDIRAFIISNIGSWSFVGKKFTKKFVVKG